MTAGTSAPAVQPKSAFERHRVLLLNADYRPLGFPLLTLTAPQVVTALLLERVKVVRDSGLVAHSPRLEINIPSVVALRRYVNVQGLTSVPSCNRFNLFVRDRGTCQYTGLGLSYQSSDRMKRATIDHVHPISRGGGHGWRNCVISSLTANIQKGGRRPEEASMNLLTQPWTPTGADLLTLWLTEERLKQLDSAWVEFLALAPSARVQRVLEKLAA